MSTDTTARPTFLGIEIHGDISKSDRKDQRPMEEFAPLVQAILDDPTVVEFGWRQYTPYFNDGEPCVFSATGAWVRLTTDKPAAGEDHDEEYEDLDILYGSKDRLGERKLLRWEGDYPNREAVFGPYAGPDEARHDRLVRLAKAIDSDEFCDALLDAFGDHARVTIRRDGIQVETYEHD